MVASDSHFDRVVTVLENTVYKDKDYSSSTTTKSNCNNSSNFSSNKSDKSNESNESNESDKSNNLENDPKEKSWFTNSYWKYIIAGVISGIFIAGFLWVADRIGSMWGALIASIPVSLIAGIVFIQQEKLNTFIFALILGTIAYLTAAAIFFMLCNGLGGFGKWTILFISLVVWVIVIGVLYYFFRESLKDEK